MGDLFLILKMCKKLGINGNKTEFESYKTSQV